MFIKWSKPISNDAAKEIVLEWIHNTSYYDKKIICVTENHWLVDCCGLWIELLGLKLGINMDEFMSVDFTPYN